MLLGRGGEGIKVHPWSGGGSGSGGGGGSGGGAGGSGAGIDRGGIRGSFRLRYVGVFDRGQGWSALRVVYISSIVESAVQLKRRAMCVHFGHEVLKETLVDALGRQGIEGTIGGRDDHAALRQGYLHQSLQHQRREGIRDLDLIKAQHGR